jgi:hypothetical protein
MDYITGALLLFIICMLLIIIWLVYLNIYYLSIALENNLDLYKVQLAKTKKTGCDHDGCGERPKYGSLLQPHKHCGKHAKLFGSVKINNCLWCGTSATHSSTGFLPVTSCGNCCPTGYKLVRSLQCKGCGFCRLLHKDHLCVNCTSPNYKYQPIIIEKLSKHFTFSRCPQLVISGTSYPIHITTDSINFNKGLAIVLSLNSDHKHKVLTRINKMIKCIKIIQKKYERLPNNFMVYRMYHNGWDGTISLSFV